MQWCFGLSVSSRDVIKLLFLMFTTTLFSVTLTSCESRESRPTVKLSFPFGIWASQMLLVVKNLPANAGDTKRHRFNPWVGNIPWRRKWQPTPVFLLGKFHGQRSLASCSPWGRKESDTTEWLNFHFHFSVDSELARGKMINWGHLKILKVCNLILIIILKH